MSLSDEQILRGLIRGGVRRDVAQAVVTRSSESSRYVCSTTQANVATNVLQDLVFNEGVSADEGSLEGIFTLGEDGHLTTTEECTLSVTAVFNFNAVANLTHLGAVRYAELTDPLTERWGPNATMAPVAKLNTPTIIPVSGTYRFPAGDGLMFRVSHDSTETLTVVVRVFITRIA